MNIKKDKNDKSIYRQIVDSVCKDIQTGRLQKGDSLPSLNSLKEKYGISRDSIFYAYNILKTRGVINSKPGKGYYVINTDVSITRRIMLLFDENSAYKTQLYNSIIENSDKDDKVDIFYHHQNEQIFQSITEQVVGNYTHYVVIPIPGEVCKNALAEMERKGNLLILDYGFEEQHLQYPSVYQDFEQDIYTVLLENQAEFSAYKKIRMIIPKPVTHTEKEIVPQIKKGFRKFARKISVKTRIGSSLPAKVEKGVCYILHSDSDLVSLIDQTQQSKLKIGEDVGVISFNETPLKRVVDKGVTTFSTDFVAMGQTVMQMIHGSKQGSNHNPCKLIRRNSF